MDRGKFLSSKEMQVNSSQNPATNFRGRSFQSEGLSTAKVRCWANSVSHRGPKTLSKRSKDRAESGLHIKSQSNYVLDPAGTYVYNDRSRW